MAQIIASSGVVTQNSNVVQFPGADLSAVATLLANNISPAFHRIHVDAVYSIIAADAGATPPTVTLSVPYVGQSETASCIATVSFSPITGLYEPDVNDVDIAILLKHMLVRKIDAGAGMASHLGTYNHGLIAHTNRTVLDDLGDSSGVLQYKGASIGGGHTIQEAGTPQAARTGLNFAAPFEIADDAGNNRTTVSIPEVTASASGLMASGYYNAGGQANQSHLRITSTPSNHTYRAGVVEYINMYAPAGANDFDPGTITVPADKQLWVNSVIVRNNGTGRAVGYNAEMYVGPDAIDRNYPIVGSITTQGSAAAKAIYGVATGAEGSTGALVALVGRTAPNSTLQGGNGYIVGCSLALGNGTTRGVELSGGNMIQGGTIEVSAATKRFTITAGSGSFTLMHFFVGKTIRSDNWVNAGNNGYFVVTAADSAGKWIEVGAATTLVDEVADATQGATATMRVASSVDYGIFSQNSAQAGVTYKYSFMLVDDDGTTGSYFIKYRPADASYNKFTVNKTGQVEATSAIAVKGAAYHPVAYFNRAEGTFAAITPVQSGTILGQFSFNGYYNSNSYTTGADILAVAEGDFNAFDDAPARLEFRTTPGSAVPTLVLRSSGKIGINKSDPTERLEVGGNIKADFFYGSAMYLTDIPTSGMINDGTQILTPLPIITFHSTSGYAYNSAATVTNTGSVNIPTGQTYNVNGVPHTHSVYAALAGAEFSGNISTAGNIGVGTTSPRGRLNVEASSGNTFIGTGAAQAAGVELARYNGSMGSITQPTATQLLGSIGFGSYDSDGTTVKSGVKISAKAAENHVNAGARGTNVTLEVAAIGASSRTEYLRFESERIMYMANCVAAPGSNPTGGGYFYVESGALKYRGSSGTVTTIANA